MSRKNQPQNLYKEAEPLTIELDVKLLVLMSFIFFIILGLIGFYFRHYPSITGVTGVI